MLLVDLELCVGRVWESVASDALELGKCTALSLSLASLVFLKSVMPLLETN